MYVCIYIVFLPFHHVIAIYEQGSPQPPTHPSQMVPPLWPVVDVQFIRSIWLRGETYVGSMCMQMCKE